MVHSYLKNMWFTQKFQRFMTTSPDVTPIVWSQNSDALANMAPFHGIQRQNEVDQKSQWCLQVIQNSIQSGEIVIDCVKLLMLQNRLHVLETKTVPWLYHQHLAGKFCNQIGYTSSTSGRPNRRVIQSAAGLKISLLRIAPSFVRSST